MNNGLEKIHVIDRTKLSSELYFESLLAEAHRKTLLSDGDIERLQYECLNLLAYQTERYNGGDSSSIRVEKAQDTMTSILFAIGVWLKTYPNPDDAVAALRRDPVKALYQKGRKRIDTLLSTTKVIHTKLVHQLVDTKNVFYHGTLVGGILGFFRLYYPDYAAHEIHITADYPLYNPAPKLAGIEFMKTYVEAAYCENQFCRFFAAADIHHLLSGYVADYQEQLINIYEPILTPAIGCIVAGVDCSRPHITEAGAHFLCQTFARQQRSEMMDTLIKAADDLKRALRFHRIR